jgi:hypothetical protein
MRLWWGGARGAAGRCVIRPHMAPQALAPHRGGAGGTLRHTLESRSQPARALCARRRPWGGEAPAASPPDRHGPALVAAVVRQAKRRPTWCGNCRAAERPWRGDGRGITLAAAVATAIAASCARALPGSGPLPLTLAHVISGHGEERGSVRDGCVGAGAARTMRGWRRNGGERLCFALSRRPAAASGTVRRRQGQRSHSCQSAPKAAAPYAAGGAAARGCAAAPVAGSSRVSLRQLYLAHVHSRVLVTGTRGLRHGRVRPCRRSRVTGAMRSQG